MRAPRMTWPVICIIRTTVTKTQADTNSPKIVSLELGGREDRRGKLKRQNGTRLRVQRVLAGCNNVACNMHEQSGRGQRGGGGARREGGGGTLTYHHDHGAHAILAIFQRLQQPMAGEPHKRLDHTATKLPPRPR